MKKIAFATDRENPTIFDSNELLVPLLKKAGFHCAPAVWDDPSVDWSQFSGTLIRSTWDYWKDAPAFLKWIKDLEAMGQWVFNSSTLIQWNLQKTYLKELEKKGVRTLPTLWGEAQTLGELLALAQKAHSEKVVIKPTFSCNAHRTLVLKVEGDSLIPQFEQESLQSVLNTPLMIQPFFPEVMEEGEWSLLYYGGEFSHGFLKRPKAGEFRVQERFGGESLAQLLPAGARAFADHVMQKLQDSPLYARVDLLRRGKDFYLMELEMIEPSLYFNLEDEAPARFVEVLLKAIEKKQKN